MKNTQNLSRKEIFQKEINTGATIQEIKIYVHSLELILAANGQGYFINSKEEKIIYRQSDSFLSIEENDSLSAEIKDLKKKIKIFEKSFKKYDF